MLIKKPDDLAGSPITPESSYVNRRTFMRLGVLGASGVATGLLYQRLSKPGVASTTTPAMLISVSAPTASTIKEGFSTSEPKTPYDAVTNYNNFYEFSLDKSGVAAAAAGFVSRPWQISVGGLCSKPTVFDIDDLLKRFQQEERFYRMRCVEAWSMVIPWDGIPLQKILAAVEPLSSAKFVAFETLFDPKRMPNQSGRELPWPYVEGLRMDEAMHPLTLMATGIYGRSLPPQDGAPIRLVTPWKYGFKGIKSIVKMTLTDTQPPSTWNISAPDEYGFYANVNPNVDHPRWTQGYERRITTTEDRQATLMFNGYADQVGSLYSGLDLRKNF
jgi:methionine sulfoxide reductase catalytic subunit